MKWLLFGACVIAFASGLAVEKDEKKPTVPDDDDIPATENDPWVNSYDHHFKFTCPRGRAITHVTSKHHNHYEDRIYDFHCVYNGAITSNCRWSYYTNEFRQNQNFRCPRNQVMTGVESYHKNGKEDRRFKFECCKLNGQTKYCGYSGWVNREDKPVNYGIHGKFITGQKSKFSWFRKDRKFGYYTCEIKGSSNIGK